MNRCFDPSLRSVTIVIMTKEKKKTSQSFHLNWKSGQLACSMRRIEWIFCPVVISSLELDSTSLKSKEQMVWCCTCRWSKDRSSAWICFLLSKCYARALRHHRWVECRLFLIGWNLASPMKSRRRRRNRTSAILPRFRREFLLGAQNDGHRHDWQWLSAHPSRRRTRLDPSPLHRYFDHLFRYRSISTSVHRHGLLFE